MNERKCRQIVYERAGQCCERCCRGSGPLTVHHRKKRSQGGGWTPANCVLACGHGTAGCHGWFEHYPDKAHAEGWHVRPWESPADIPVWWRMSKWVLLNDSGDLVDV